MNVLFAPASSEFERRRALYHGELLVFPPSPSTLLLANFARGLIEEAFSPWHPQHAHHHIEVQKAVEILVRLKPHFIHHPKTKELLQRVLLDHGCHPDQTRRCLPRRSLGSRPDSETPSRPGGHRSGDGRGLCRPVVCMASARQPRLTSQPVRVHRSARTAGTPTPLLCASHPRPASRPPTCFGRIRCPAAGTARPDRGSRPPSGPAGG